MFREVRKKKNAISVEDAKAILRSARRGILAVNGDDGYPYAIPINYLYDEEAERIYFHGARAGHKVDALKGSDKICFTVCGEETIKDLDWAPYVQSTVVFGRCHLIADPAFAMEKLKQFAMKYYPTEQSVVDEIADNGKYTQMFEIEIEHVSGKEVQEK